MLTISVEKVCEIIDMALQANGKVTPVEEPPPADPGDDSYIGAIAEYAEDPSFDLLRQTLEDLYNDEKADLLALIWLRAGDVFPELQFEEMQTRAAEEIHRQDFVDRVANRPFLADELADALDELGYSCDGLTSLERNAPGGPPRGLDGDVWGTGASGPGRRGRSSHDNPYGSSTVEPVVLRASRSRWAIAASLRA